MAETTSEAPVTDRDLQDMRDALMVARQLGRLEPLLRSAISARKTVDQAEAKVKELRAEAAGLADTIRAERRVAEAALETAIAQRQAKVTADMAEAERIAQEIRKASQADAAKVREAIASEQAEAENAKRRAMAHLRELEERHRVRCEEMASAIQARKAEFDKAVAEHAAQMQGLKAEQQEVQGRTEAIKKEHLEILTRLRQLAR